MKNQLTAQGWNVANVRERLAKCRKGLREAKAQGGSAVYTYRFLYVCQYLQNRSRLTALQS